MSLYTYSLNDGVDRHLLKQNVYCWHRCPGVVVKSRIMMQRSYAWILLHIQIRLKELKQVYTISIFILPYPTL